MISLKRLESSVFSAKAQRATHETDPTELSDRQFHHILSTLFIRFILLP